MLNQIIVKNKIKDINKSISVSGDKSLSIRWVLFSSIANGKSKAYNLLLSEDVLAAINAIKKLGAKVKLKKKLLHNHRQWTKRLQIPKKYKD